jgi:hypothetical protein
VADAWPAAKERRHGLQIVMRHAFAFATWRSLEAEGVAPKTKVDLLLVWIIGAAR